MGDTHLTVDIISNNQTSLNHSCNQSSFHHLLEIINLSIELRHQAESSTPHNSSLGVVIIMQCTGETIVIKQNRSKHLSWNWVSDWTGITKHTTKQMRHFLTLGWTLAEWDQDRKSFFP